MVYTTTYLKIGMKPRKSGLKEAMLKDNWREELVTLVAYPVVLKCCFCFLERVHVSVLFLPHTVGQERTMGSSIPTSLFIPEHVARDCVQLGLEYLK